MSAPDQSHATASLARALIRHVTQRGVAIEPDVLTVALGWPFLVCAVPDETRCRFWPHYARDAFLVEACRLFAITVRPLHPPEAARGLADSAEFRQHFDASYRPLVMRALENGQGVLAWRGWAAVEVPVWGVITAACDDGVGLTGFACGSAASDEDRVAPLESPPVQLYVVESIDVREPSSSDWDRHLNAVASASVRSELDERFGIVTGPRAIDLWMRVLETGRASANEVEVMRRSLACTCRRLAQVVTTHAVSRPLSEYITAMLKACSEEATAAPLVRLQSIRAALSHCQVGSES